MTTQTNIQLDGTVPEVASNDVYLNYLADILLRYITDEGRKTNLPEVYKDVMAVTSRTIGTVKNWLTYRTHAPDVASLARIVAHWSIPTAAIFPNRLAEILGGSNVSSSVEAEAEPNPMPFIRLYGPNDKALVDGMLRRYTGQPGSVVFVKKEGSDMRDEIGTDELMLVDTSSERVEMSGIYLLRLDEPGTPVMVRHVEHELGDLSKPTSEVTESSWTSKVALSKGSLSTAQPHIAPLVDGVIPNITVLGRVVAILRAT